MSNFTICAKRLLLDVKVAQSNPKASTLNETIFAILSDSEDFLQRQIRSDFMDGVPATVGIKRPPFNCNTGADCGATPLCETTGVAVNKPRWETFEIDDCITTTDPYEITAEDYELACNGTLSQAFTDAVAMASDELKRGLNVRAIAYLKANVGNWVDGSATKTLPISASTTGVGLYPTWSLIQEQFASVGITTMPNIIGGSPIYQVMSVYNVTNPLTGFSASTAGGVTMYYEPGFNGATPANQIVAWSPQSVQIVTYNKYLKGFAQGTNVSSTADVEKVWKEGRLRTTGAIPVLFYTNKNTNTAPIQVWAEFEAIPDNCGNMKFALSIRYKFVKVLTDLCGGEGFNGIFTLTTCSPTIPACPDEPTPVVPVDYCMTWDDTPCESPYLVSSITIGGVTYSGVPMNYTNLASLVTIINTFVGSTIVYLDGGVIHSALPLSSGSLNGVNYPFSFAECPGS